MIRAFVLGLCLLLSACASQTPLPQRPAALAVDLPLSLHIQRQQGARRQDWLLVLQRQGQDLHWTLLDPLGVPLARQRLVEGSWQNDGLLPPNAEARALFAALLFALTPAEALAQAYPPGSWTLGADGQRRLNPAWRIRYRAGLDFTLQHDSDLSYRVRVLAAEEDR